MNQPVVPRPAATITIVRDQPQGLEVLMMQRNLKSGFMPGAYVFPGGAVDAEDSDEALYARCRGMDDASASRRLGLARDGLAYWVAAIRECFEEAGLLLCYDRSGCLIEFHGREAEARFAAHRTALNAGELGFKEMIESEDLVLAADLLTYFSHWITPVGAPRRYDTRFFVTVAPAAQSPLHDAAELIDQLWVRPHDALERDREGTLTLRTPTKATLRQLGEVSQAGGLVAKLAAQPEIPAILPVVSRDGGRLLPGDPGYEAAAADPAPKWR